ncbi:18289_t:CDS:2 [Funneliformis geosporum]|nr:18289_t:CDS:2 [Funneliformis geosporum]
MTDFMLGERPSKRPFFGSTNPSNFFDDDDEQYFAFSKAASDSGGYSMVGLTNPSSSIMPNGSHHALNDNKDVSVMDTSVGSGNSLSSNCNASMTTLDDVKLNAPINNNKGASANTDVTNVSCKAEPGTILEDTFKTNTSPNSKVREALAEKVNMSERSIQIWFQNRRAKMKAMQKRAHLMINQDTIGHHFMACMPGYGHNLFPYRMPIHQRIALPRSYSANDLSPLNNVNALGMRSAPNSAGLGITVPQVPQGFWPSGPLTAPIPMTTSEHLMNGFPFSANPLVNAQPQTQSQRFPISPNASPNSNAMNSAQALRLVVNPNNGIPIKMNGSWRRILTMSSPTDLLCYYTLPQNIFTYHITNENTQFKMEFPLSDIFSVEFRPIDEVHSQIAIEVKSPPSFFMEAPHGGWNMCKDFTEDRQATRNRRHVLKGRSVVMKPQLIKLMQVDQNLAKVVTILDIPAPADPLSPDMAEDDIMMNNNGQQNPPRRSSFPVSGPIANHIQYSDPQKGNIKHEMNLLNQMVRVQRRSASAPISPSEENRNSSLGIPMSQQNLQIDTSTNFLEMFKADSSPEFCSSPMELNSSPSTPLDVFDNSPALMDSSPLLNQDPFVSLPSHNLSNLTLDSVTSTLLSDEQVAAAMVTFAPPMNSHDLQNVSNEDFANMFMSSGSDTASDGSEFLNFNDNIHGNDNYGSNTMNLDTSAWVGDVAYC